MSNSHGFSEMQIIMSFYHNSYSQRPKFVGIITGVEVATPIWSATAAKIGVHIIMTFTTPNKEC